MDERVERGGRVEHAGRDGRGRRIADIDVLRGFALCGILPVNIVQMTDPPAPGAAFDVLLQGRFFPIFAFLFGVSAVLFLRGAGRAALLWRFAVLVPFGAVHQLGQPGEVLLPYAVIGAVFLLPASYAGASGVLAAGLLVTAGAMGFTTGGWSLVPGMFLLGAAAMRHEAFALPARTLAIAFAALAAAATGLNAWQLGPADPRVFGTAGVVTAAAYGTGLLLLLRTGARRALTEVLGPMGRLALTCYVSATPMILLADRLHGVDDGRDAAALAVVILAVQVVFARWWTSRFRYGPLEWAWRSLTWRRAMPLRAPVPPSR
ncbi:DUF418 domain-containing protein [Spirillospora sp. CA-253888]